jgi:protein-disulfide isomerase
MRTVACALRTSVLGFTLALSLYAAPAGAADPDQVVASIGGQPVRYSELSEKAAPALARQRSTYETRRKQLDTDYERAQHDSLEEALNQLLDERVLLLEARARNSTPLELLADVKTPTVTDEEVRKLFDEHAAESREPFEKVAPELRKGLIQRKTDAALADFYAALRARYAAVATLEPLRAKVAAVGPSRGPANAPVTIVEFADFQCPYCRRMEPLLAGLFKRYPDQLRLVYRHFPLTDVHPEALHAAEAAVCGDKQGKFWEMHDAIFADAAPLGVASLEAIARRVGLGNDEFERCVRSQEPNNLIAVDIRAAEELSVHGTPALFINGRLVPGVVGEEKLASIIDSELKQRDLHVAGTSKVAGASPRR